MSYSKTTFSNLQLSLAYRYGENAIPSSGTSNRNFWLNKAVQYMTDKLGLKKSATVTVSSGTGSLPTDYKDPVQVINSNDVEYKRVNQELYNDYSSSDTVYCITGNHKDGWTLKVPSDGDYTVYYHFFPEDMSDDSDICIIPDGEAVVAYAYAMLRKSETDPLGDAGDALAEAEQRLTDMIYNQQRQDRPLKFRILDSVNYDSDYNFE